MLLSGDVHYACSLTLDYWKKGAPKPARIVQLTSSSLHNVFKDIAQTLARNLALLQGAVQGRAAERIAWDDKAPIKVPHDKPVVPGRLARAYRSPALLNALNYVYVEWNYKPAAFVSYGGVSGGRRLMSGWRSVWALYSAP